MGNPLTKRFVRLVDRRSKVVLAMAGILLAAFVGWVDDVTGMEVSIALLYLVPILFTAWFVGKWMGLAVSLQCAVEGFIAGISGLSSYSYAAIPYWNTAMMLGFYVAVTLLLVALRDSLNHEEALARKIQENLLPATLDVSPAMTIAAAWKPSVHVGGDYFDVLPLGPDRIGFCIADVTGHGIPAALLMSNVQSAVRLLAVDALSPAEICARLNQQTTMSFPDGDFLTLFFGVLYLPTRQLTYCNAGHNPPVVVKGDGTTTILQSGDGVLGIARSWIYHDESIVLDDGDKILLYTDGVTEARNSAGELWGEDRLLDLLAKNHMQTPEHIKDSILGALEAYTQGNTDDDITLMCIAFDGSADRRPYGPPRTTPKTL